MNGALEILRRERLNAQEQMKALRARVRDLDLAISLLDASASSEGSKPQGDLKQKVLLLLEERADGATPSQIASLLTTSGRQTSDQSVSSTLSRLKGEGKVRNANGVWFAIKESSDSQIEESATASSVDDFEDLDDIPF